MRFKDARIAVKLGLGFGLGSALLLAVVVLAWLRLQALDDSLVVLTQDRYPKMALVQEIRSEQDETARNLRDMLLMDAPAQIADELANIRESQGIIDKNLGNLSTSIRSPAGQAHVAKVRAAADAFAPLRDKFIAERDRDPVGARQLLLRETRPVQLSYMRARRLRRVPGQADEQARRRDRRTSRRHSTNWSASHWPGACSA